MVVCVCVRVYKDEGFEGKRDSSRAREQIVRELNRNSVQIFRKLS